MPNENTKVVTGKSRFSYVHVFEKRAMAEGADEKYSLSVLIPKSDKATKARLDAAIQAAAVAGAQKCFGGTVPKKLPSPVYDGDGERPNGDEFGDECKGCWVITASSRTQPGIVDAALSPIINKEELYSGCYGRVSLNFFAYNKAGKKGIGCGLNNVQKLADGEPLDGRSSAEDDFADDFVDEPVAAPKRANPIIVDDDDDDLGL